MDQAGTHDRDAAWLNRELIDHAVLPQRDLNRHRTRPVDPARLAVRRKFGKEVALSNDVEFNRTIVERNDQN